VEFLSRQLNQTPRAGFTRSLLRGPVRAAATRIHG
jgi:hypothetical protein